MKKKENFKKVICPYCGYKNPVFYDEKSKSAGLFIVCKGRNCKKLFEISINNKVR